ncbi:MFS transporter [Amycolatopsis sp. WAC 04197]|uniref:MFS transporter n=1 Tax=Amycolatopsis sp. WAC 04197 TaxID=2203199 RepID=UPI000F787CBD|nr:MFS transporter [Amycolatopsis sp. WAC 04197]
MKAAEGNLRRPALLAVLCAAQFAVMVDVVVVNVALPSIQGELGVPQGTLQLTAVSYTVVFGSLLIVAGRAGDRFGRRGLLLCGLLVFTVASGLCGLVDEAWQLFAARAGQGIGAAMVSPNAMALLTSSSREGEQRDRALGFWIAASAGGAIAGQLLGGVLTELAGWRAIFLLHVPLGVLVFVVALRFLPSGTMNRSSTLDLRGAMLLTVSLAALSLLLAGVTKDSTIATVMGIVVLLVLASVLLVVERRHPAPVLPGGLIRRRPVLVANIVQGLTAGATTAAIYFTTLTMQGAMGYGPLQTGLGFAPVTAIVLLVSPRAGALVSRLGARNMLVLGTGIAAVGMGLLGSTATAFGNYWAGILPGLALVAAGNGLSYTPAYSVATAVPEGDQGASAGLISTTQELGAALGLASVAPVVAFIVGSEMSDFSMGYLISALMVIVAGLLALVIPAKSKPLVRAG